jgi:glucose/arabinose dehydrogenase
VIGLRNSFDFAFDALDTEAPFRAFAGENGFECDDELNRIEAGYNYGHRVGSNCEDGNPSPTYNTIPPLWYVPRSECCIGPTGTEVYTGSSIPEWQNHLFMCAFHDAALRHFYLDESRTLVLSVASVEGVACHLDVQTGPDGALYYIEGGGPRCRARSAS